MKTNKSSNNKKIVNRITDILPTGIIPEPDGHNPIEYSANEQIEKDLNSKILEITMRIKDDYPELSQYIEEMPVTIPSENDPEITLNHLRSYYESLNSLLNKYKVDNTKSED